MALTPWPTTPAALAAAVAELAGALGASAADDGDQLARVGAVASALVEDFAAGAPLPVRVEAVLRTSGWLWDTPSAGVRSDTVGPISVDFTPTHTGALRASGGMSLLSPWRRRSGGLT